MSIRVTSLQREIAGTPLPSKKRKRGPQRKTKELMAFLEANNYDPAHALLSYRIWLNEHAIKANKVHAKYRSTLTVEDRERVRLIGQEELDLRDRCAEVDSSLMRYVYPIRKAIEMKGNAGMSWVDVLSIAVSDEGEE